MPARNLSFRRLTPAFTLACLVLLAGVAAAAQGERLRERIRERLVDRAEQQAGPSVPARRLASGQRIAAPGRYEIRLQHGGSERMALIHVPRNYRAGEPAPLVMALHGGGGSAAIQADDARYGLITKSEQAGFVAVFPNGISPSQSGLLATWNAGDCCAKARDENVDDVGFLRAVVADIRRRLDISAQRVYAIGMSNGAMMAYRLACEAPDVFHGIMAVAGTDNTRQCSPQTAVPVLHVHARDDDRVLFGGGAGERFRRDELVADFVSVPDTIRKWVALNRAQPEPRRVLATSGAWCDLHAATPGGAAVQLCVTDTGGHSWPGAATGRAGAEPSSALRANDVMWAFFNPR